MGKVKLYNICQHHRGAWNYTLGVNSSCDWEITLNTIAITVEDISPQWLFGRSADLKISKEVNTWQGVLRGGRSEDEETLILRVLVKSMECVSGVASGNFQKSVI